MFKNMDIVAIKPEWCESVNEESLNWVVSDVNYERQTCLISMIEPEKHGRYFGLSNTVSFDMIYKL